MSYRVSIAGAFYGRYHAQELTLIAPLTSFSIYTLDGFDPEG